jgi:hypothetical protein
MQMQVDEVQQNIASSDAWYVMFHNTDRQLYSQFVSIESVKSST